jgi:hypothetical protein
MRGNDTSTEAEESLDKAKDPEELTRLKKKERGSDATCAGLRCDGVD